MVNGVIEHVQISKGGILQGIKDQCAEYVIVACCFTDFRFLEGYERWLRFVR